MTELHYSLLGIAGAFVVAVFIFNKWQEHKARKTVENAFDYGHHDVLLQTESANRQEPVLEEGNTLPNLQMRESEVLLPEFLTPTEQILQIEPGVQSQKNLPVDELIDCVIPLEFDAPLRGEKILSEIAELKFVGKKPVHFVGQTLAGERDLISAGNSYSTLFAGIQTVRRSGSLSELEFSEFIMRLRSIADNLNAFPDIPDMHKVVNGARELHQFVAEHDAQLSVNVASNGAPWALHTLVAVLEKMGFDQRPDGRLMMPDGEGGSLFTLSTNVGVAEPVTARLTLLLDVPCVAPERDAFGAMAACAKSLATRLDGTVVDDGNQAISKPALDEIAAQVNEFYAAMAEAQVPAGSLRAQRLFS